MRLIIDRGQLIRLTTSTRWNGVLRIEDNPSGIASQSPGLLYSATWDIGSGGHSIASGPNPNGVVPLAPRMMNNQTWRRRVTANVRPQPLQGCRNSRLDIRAMVTQGSRVQQLWAVGCNPFGVTIPPKRGGRLS